MGGGVKGKGNGGGGKGDGQGKGKGKGKQAGGGGDTRQSTWKCSCGHWNVFNANYCGKCAAERKVAWGRNDTKFDSKVDKLIKAQANEIAKLRGEFAAFKKD